MHEQSEEMEGEEITTNCTYVHIYVKIGFQESSVMEMKTILMPSVFAPQTSSVRCCFFGVFFPTAVVETVG